MNLFDAARIVINSVNNLRRDLKLVFSHFHLTKSGRLCQMRFFSEEFQGSVFLVMSGSSVYGEKDISSAEERYSRPKG